MSIKALVFGIMFIWFVSPPGTPTPTSPILGDSSILTHKPCEFPCWYGITPGTTSLNAAHTILQAVNFYVSASQIGEETSDQSNHNSHTVIYWWYTQSNERSIIDFDDNIVYAIKIVPLIDFTLNDVLELYGEPEGIKVTYDIGLEQPYIIVLLDIYYPSRGLIVTFQLYSANGSAFVGQVKLDANVKGINFTLYKPTDTLKQFAEEVQDDMEHIHIGWPGSGSILVTPNDDHFPLVNPIIQTPTPTPDATLFGAKSNP